jgi:hypothetical protein
MGAIFDKCAISHSSHPPLQVHDVPPLERYLTDPQRYEVFACGYTTSSDFEAMNNNVEATGLKLRLILARAKVSTPEPELWQRQTET